MEYVGVSIKYVTFEEYEFVANMEIVNKHKISKSFFNKILLLKSKIIY